MEFHFGKNHNINESDYHADREYLSSSVLKKALKSPALYQDFLLNGYQPKNLDSLHFGTLVHAMILEPDTVQKRFAIFNPPVNDKRTKLYKEAKAEFDKVKGNRIAIDQDSFDRANILVSRLTEDASASSMLQTGEAEVSFFGELDGRKIKVRTDFIDYENKRIIDIKTTKDATYSSFNRDFKWNYDYDLSAALYTDMVSLIMGEKYTFHIIALHKEDPFGVAIYDISDESMEVGRQKYLRAIRNIRDCENTGNFYFQKRMSL
jgi:exodeoxyribonuclease VIII